MAAAFGILAGVTVWGGAPPQTAHAAPDGSRFIAVTPARLLDSRPGSGPADDGVEGIVRAGGLVDVQVAGRFGVPSTSVSAVVLNVTVTEAIAPGFVQVLPTGSGVVGSSSNLNVGAAGQTIPNQVTVPLGAGGRVSIFVQSGAHVIADLFGYFTPATVVTSGRYSPLPAPSPVRVLDTRDPFKVPVADPGDTKNCSDFATWDEAWRWFWTHDRWMDPARLDADRDNIPCNSLPGGTKQPSPPIDLFALAPGGTIRVPVARGGDLPGGVAGAGQVTAVVANVTVTSATAPGYWQVLPTGAGQLGASSNLNVERAGQTISNQVIAPVGQDGTITIFSQSGGHVIVDVAGVFTGPASIPSSDGLFVPVTPDRLLDTRQAAITPVIGPIAAGGSVTVETAGRLGIPAGAAALALNLTVTESTAAGFVQAFPTGGATAGASSNINAERTGQTIPNAAYTTLGTAGRFSLFTQSGGQLLADAAGWFTGTTARSSDLLGTLVLANLRVEPEVVTPLADVQAAFPHWTIGPAGCTTRELILLAYPVNVPATPAQCVVTTGDWTSFYDGVGLTSASSVAVDHVVALREAWESGAAGWSIGQRTRFANDLSDPRTLIISSLAADAAKGDRDPASWTPSNPGFVCSFISNWLGIKARWGLSVDTAERDAIAALLVGPCNGLIVGVWTATT